MSREETGDLPPRTGWSRRRILAGLGWGFAGLALAYRPVRNWWRLDCREGGVLAGGGYGPLHPDPHGILDLPEGFTYSILCRQGERMDDGYRVPGSADGAGVFAMPDGGYRILRNHELGASQASRGAFIDAPPPSGDTLFDPVCQGGVITLELDKSLRVRRRFLSLAGTERNCSGGVTPWGSWLSCEESVVGPRDGRGHRKRHGYVFEVPAAGEGLAPPRPLRAMGRFNHEGAAVEPGTGAVYMTEDRGDGCLYRFIPERPGRLERGRLFALGIVGLPGADTSGRGVAGEPPITRGSPLAANWVELLRPDPREDTLRLQARSLGAAIFSRGEGIAWDGNGVVFTATNGGANSTGQVWRYLPTGMKEGRLTLLAESGAHCDFNKPDNIAVQPNGDLLVAEDNNRFTRLIGIAPGGGQYPFAYFQYGTREELSGMAFSPDRRFMVVSAYELGMTFLVTGPFAELS